MLQELNDTSLVLIIVLPALLAVIVTWYFRYRREFRMTPSQRKANRKKFNQDWYDKKDGFGN